MYLAKVEYSYTYIFYSEKSIYIIGTVVKHRRSTICLMKYISAYV